MAENMIMFLVYRYQELKEVPGWEGHEWVLLEHLQINYIILSPIATKQKMVFISRHAGKSLSYVMKHTVVS